MQLKLVRSTFTDTCTQGELLLDGSHFCYTLELPNRDGQPGSCIPPGTYPVKAVHSPKFGREMPLVDGIPSRSEIEIHWGNMVADTNGCILIGKTMEVNFIGQSRDAFDELWAATVTDMRAGKLTIEVVNDPAVTNVEDVRQISSE